MPCQEDSMWQHLAASNRWLFPFTVRKHSVSLEGVTQISHLWLSIHHSFMFSTLVLCESAVTTDLCKKKLLWSELTATFSMWNKHNYLEGNLSSVSCSFSKTAIISKLGYVNSQPWALARFINTRCKFPPVEQAWKLIRKPLVILTTDFPLQVGTCYLAGQW